MQFCILVILVFILTSGGSIADLFLSGRASSDGYSTGSVLPSVVGTVIRTYAPIPFLAFVVIVAILNIDKVHANMAGLAGAAVYLGTAQVTNSLSVGGFNPTPRWWIVVALIVALWSIGPDWEDLRFLGGFVVLLGSVSLVTTVIGPGWMLESSLVSGESKALIGTRLLAGIFPQMNILGLTMVLGFPFVIMLKRLWIRIWGIAIVLAALVLSASRTSLLAAGVVIVASFLIRMAKMKSRRAFLATSIALAVAATVVILPMTVDDPDALTSRGSIWMASMSEIPKHFVVGLSTNAYTREGIMPPLIGHTPWHGHNLFVSTMIWGGIVLFAALCVFFVTSFRRSIDILTRSSSAYLFLLALLACSMAEMPLRIDDFDGVAWLSWTALLAVLLVSPPGDRVEASVDVPPVETTPKKSRIVLHR